ncbi:MAG TPA: prepilin-type N-terminal cleavage/methylation domain-containing protein [Phycisphaerae bacterium]|nr:prepilin-type N-terminal cleavage/methylation domain-containing protein [Phycisphaerae bacterium]
MKRHFSQPLNRPQSSQPARSPRAFTLIEVMVVISIIVILLAVSIPTIKALTTGSREAQAVNLIRSYLVNARALAMREHHLVGVVFFEEDPNNHKLADSPPANTSQTAMQLIMEDPDQSQFLPGKNLGFIYYSRDRQYLPRGVQVALLNDDATKTMTTGDESSGVARCILFDQNGQMVLRSRLVRPKLTGATDVGGYPQAYKDWNFDSAGTTSGSTSSSPGLVVFDMQEYKAQNFTTAQSDKKAQWLQQHADVLIVNPYTGSLIQ